MTAVSLDLTMLLDYTDWERGTWRSWFGQHPQALTISTGLHGDGRFEALGHVVRHIFSAEQRYVERLAGRPLSDTSTIAVDSVDALFEFGRQSRVALRELIAAFPPAEWDAPRDFTLMNNQIRATPRKIVIHVLMHEIRHWAQIATTARLQGLKVEPHDFLFSPILGGGVQR
ncbi:MAG TPA: DinB family protein [Gemmatimonadales bacterium]|jgi:uncharacterized damage-inducible protein DinB|nr:DinB family protein [Gemmatimonadales bacterium]